MAYAYIVDTTATQVATGKVPTLKIQVNAALTGTIKVIDGTSGSTANVATITNPAVGNIFEYHDLTLGARIIASGSCDITAETNSSLNWS